MLRIDDQIVVKGRVLVVRGFDPFAVPAGRVSLEDETTGEPFTELMTCLQARRACDWGLPSNARPAPRRR